MNPLNPVHLTETEEIWNLKILETLVDLKIQTMLRKDAIQMVEDSQNQFSSPIFLLQKRLKLQTGGDKLK